MIWAGLLCKQSHLSAEKSHANNYYSCVGSKRSDDAFVGPHQRNSKCDKPNSQNSYPSFSWGLSSPSGSGLNLRTTPSVSDTTTTLPCPALKYSRIRPVVAVLTVLRLLHKTLTMIRQFLIITNVSFVISSISLTFIQMPKLRALIARCRLGLFFSL